MTRGKAGATVHVRTIRVVGVGEGAIAEVLRAAADARRDLSFGSYPFGLGEGGEVETQLVIRGRDVMKVDLAEHDLSQKLRSMGIDIAVT